MMRGGLVRAREGDAGDARIGQQELADPRAVARQKVQDLARHARRCRSGTAACATSGVCSAGLAMTALPAAKRGRDLAGEDRQREIPRRDAGEDAAAVQRQLVALARGSGQSDGACENCSRARSA